MLQNRSLLLPAVQSSAGVLGLQPSVLPRQPRESLRKLPALILFHYSLRSQIRLCSRLVCVMNERSAFLCFLLKALSSFRGKNLRQGSAFPAQRRGRAGWQRGIPSACLPTASSRCHREQLPENSCLRLHFPGMLVSTCLSKGKHYEKCRKPVSKSHLSDSVLFRQVPALPALSPVLQRVLLSP